MREQVTVLWEEGGDQHSYRQLGLVPELNVSLYRTLHTVGPQ